MQTLSDIIASLNPEQGQAVAVNEGPTLVVAGAGSGKTRVLTVRMARLLQEKRALPQQILAVTFTNKASKEMRERIGRFVGEEQAAGLWMGSFHGVSLRILRRHAQAAGLKNDHFKILDDDAQLLLVKEAGIETGLIEEADAKDIKRRVKELHAAIQQWKEEGLTPDDAAQEQDLMRLPGAKHLLQTYRVYQKKLMDRNACDFADLLLHVLSLWRRDEKIRAQWHTRFSYILVDEFQDTNRLQYDWLKMLSGQNNLFCVGDLDQSIYEWRGARPAIMMGFPKDFPNTTMITIDRNYRSTEQILDISNKIVASNARLVEKTLRSEVDGEPVEISAFPSEREEADAIVFEAERLMRQGTPASEIAILFRSAGQMRIIEQALRLRSVAYEVVGGQRFDERMEVRDAMAYLRLASDPTDDLAFLRIANRPMRGIGEASAKLVVGRHIRDQGPIADALRTVAQDSSVRVQKKARKAMLDLAQILEDLVHQENDSARTPGDVLEHALERVDYMQWLEDSGDDLAPQRYEILQDMMAEGRSGRFESSGQWLQEIMLIAAADQAQDLPKIRLSTIHAAKGLEYNVVFSPCLEDGILPNARSIQEAYGLAEERRIAHVAWTRARQRLYISCAQTRHGQLQMPSPFFQEVGLGEPALRHRFGEAVLSPHTEIRTPRPLWAPDLKRKTRW